MRITWPRILLLALASTLPSAASAPAPATTRAAARRTTTTQSINRYQRSLGLLTWGDSYQQLKLRSDWVFVVRVESVKRKSSESGDIRGRVMLQITHVIAGPKMEKISLPFFYPDFDAPSRKSYAQVWPAIDEAPEGQLFLLVVSPGNVVRGGAAGVAALPLDDEPSAASTVRPVTGMDDPIVKAYQQIITFVNTPDPQRDPSLLAAAAGHPLVPLQNYLYGVATRELKPAVAFVLIRTLITAECAADRPNSLLQEIPLLSPYYLDKSTSDDDRVAVLGLLALIVKSNSTGNVGQALASLSTISQSAAAPIAAFPKKDRDALEAAISAYAARQPEGTADQTFAPQVIAWLRK